MSVVARRAECYGKMFPDFTRLKRRERLEGQAFSALVTGSGTGAQGRSLEVRREAWDKCVECPDYRTCYDLSLAKPFWAIPILTVAGLRFGDIMGYCFILSGLMFAFNLLALLLIPLQL